MKRTPFHKPDQRARGTWVHFGAVLLLCLGAAAIVILCVLVTPAEAGGSGIENGDWNGDGLIDLLDLDAAVASVLGDASFAPTYDDFPAGDLNGDGTVDVSDVVALIDRIAPTVSSGLASGLPLASEPESPLRVIQAAPPWVIENADHCARLSWTGPRVGAAVVTIPGETPAASLATDDIETTSSLFWIDNRLRFTVCANKTTSQSSVATSVGAHTGDAAGTVSIAIGPVLIVEDGMRVVYTEKVTVELARPESENSDNAVPLRTGLLASYPNPFNPAVTIPYELAAPARATLSIYDALGRRVATLIENDRLPAGPGSVVWRGLDTGGRAVASGAYFAVLRSGAVRDVRTMILLR